jgi:PEP-utilising enzyme, mobile domain
VTQLYVDSDRYAEPPSSLLLETVRNAVTDLVRRKLALSGGSWSDFVFSASDQLITKEDFREIELQILASGYRFAWSAVISARERPEIYKETEAIGASIGSFSFEHPEAVVAVADSAGREQRGVGDNVVRRKENVIGIARYIRSSEQVIEHMKRGVPPDTIAIIDDSGGTLTAPILERFTGIVCAGGTVRSHLGILAREYGIACLMNAKISGIHDGDRIELETSALAKTAEAYQKGEEMTARIWRHAAKSLIGERIE